MEIHGATHFLKVGVLCHTSKTMMTFLREKWVAMMDWTGNLFDLNPIENLWSIIRNKLKDYHTHHIT